MDLQKIYESMGLEKLDETKAEELKNYITEAIEVKAMEVASEKIDEEKELLIEKYEEKFEEYKEDITSKFSDFVDEILEQEIQIPEKIKEYAKLGERYEPVLEQLKTIMSIDEGTIDEHAKDLLKEAKDELETMKERENDLRSRVFELTEDAKEMATHIYLRKKCDGLTESKKEKIMRILEDVKDKAEIDRKFAIINEEYGLVNEKTMYCSKCDSEVDIDEDEDEKTCPECSGKLSVKGKGKTNEEFKTFETPLNENTSIMDYWREVVRNGSL